MRHSEEPGYPERCPTCGNDGPARRRAAVDLSLCPDDWHTRHPRRIAWYDERGAYNPGLIVTIIIVVLALIGLFAVCGGNDGDLDTLRPVQVVDHV